MECAEILCIGTEILLGNIVNTNAAFIARELAVLGINQYNQSVVGDNPERLKDALHTAFDRSDIVITTGGLGPTFDDLTKETICNYFGETLELHQPSYERLVEFYKTRNRPMTENNVKQAMMPKNGKVMLNYQGTAPGVIIEGKGKTAIMLPGPPREMKPMFLEQVIPYLSGRTGRILRSHNIHFFEIGESNLDHALKERMPLMENPTLAPYAKDGEVVLRCTASAKTTDEADALIKPVIERLYKEFPEYIYGVDIDDLQHAAFAALKSRRLTVATAESCTAGYVSKRLTDIDGSSEVFGFGVASYANAAKEKLLGVKRETLEKYGAVSAEVAAEMAEGVRRVSGADIGVSVTGVAGPGGVSDKTPLGLVYIGVSSDWHSEVREYRLARNYTTQREYIRYVASSYVLRTIQVTAEMKHD